MTDDSKSARELVAKLFSTVDSSAGRQYVALHQNWQSLVGMDLAAHSEPVDIRRDALVVELDHPGWMQMLQMQERRLIERLRREFPELAIKTLQMRLRNESDTESKTDTREQPGAPAPAPRGERPAEPEPAAEPERAADGSEQRPEGLDRIDDPELRERLERLGKMVAERNREESNRETRKREERAPEKHDRAGHDREGPGPPEGGR